MITINTLAYDICYTARKIYQFLTKEFKKFDITPEQFIVLTTLFECVLQVVSGSFQS